MGSGGNEGDVVLAVVVVKTGAESNLTANLSEDEAID